MVIRKLALGIASLSLTVAVGVGFNPVNAWATAGHVINCMTYEALVGFIERKRKR